MTVQWQAAMSDDGRLNLKNKSVFARNQLHDKCKVVGATVLFKKKIDPY